MREDGEGGIWAWAWERVQGQSEERIDAGVAR